MSKSSRTAPNRYGSEFRARPKPLPSLPAVSQCINRPMTEAEKAWLESLPPPPKQPTGLTMAKPRKRRASM